MGEAETISESETIEFDRLCESCGYNLRGLTENRCPECGTAFVPNLMPLAKIPWLHRDRIGFIKAYFATVVLVTLRPATFASRFDWPARITRKDGRKFKSLTLWIAILSFVIPLSNTLIFGIARHVVPTVEAIGDVLVSIICLRIFFRLATMTTLATQSFPRNHLAEVENYAAAPLVPLALILFVMAILGQLLWAIGNSSAGIWLADATLVVLLVLSVLVWITSARLIASAGRLPRGPAFRMAIFLPVHWLGSLCAAVAITVPILGLWRLIVSIL